jgi:hypothetical protein
MLSSQDEVNAKLTQSLQRQEQQQQQQQQQQDTSDTRLRDLVKQVSVLEVRAVAVACGPPGGGFVSRDEFAGRSQQFGEAKC